MKHYEIRYEGNSLCVKEKPKEEQINKTRRVIHTNKITKVRMSIYNVNKISK